jgi:hypothetical protein
MLITSPGGDRCKLFVSIWAIACCIGLIGSISPTPFSIRFDIAVPSSWSRDVIGVLEADWDMMIAFPPCTHLASSGARWFAQKRIKQNKALAFIEVLVNAPIPKICIENPIGIISTRLYPPTQIIQPFWFGEAARKATCLWLKGLPPLEPTNIVEPDLVTYQRSDGTTTTFSADYGGGGPDSGKRRSVTYQGVANAMANQWGYLFEV